MENKFKILIVDDQPQNLQVLAFSLNDLGIKTIAAINGQSAILSAEQNLPDLILLDIMMPEMDGFEVIKILKNNPKTQNIPVIFLSAITETKEIVKGFKLGAVDYISKPFSREELIARVQNQLNLKIANDTIKQQAHEIELAYSKIRKSLNYAGMIQNITIPSEGTLKSLFPDSFVLYKPRDIVSGDFYWLAKENGKIYVAVADCTGHGVPAAMISMLGISFLNELVGTLSNYDSDYILDFLRQKVKKIFRQKDALININDGMDISFCIIDIQKMTMKFTGAEQSILIARRKNLETEIIEVKGDPMPIGTYMVESSFTEHDIKLQENDCIYMYSDGYVDQIGGGKERRFMTKNFKELIKTFALKPMSDQKSSLERTFNTWLGTENEQIDDILIIGFRI